MSPPAQTASARPPQQKYKRSFKNYLIDSGFQLKWTARIIFVALAISLVLGAFLWRTSQTVIAQSEKVVQESKKVSDVVKMSIKNDPIYGADPELAKAFAGSSTVSDQEIEKQQTALIQGQTTMRVSLVGGLSLMVVLIGLLGIFFTHKVAGPVYMMKMLLRQVGDGKLNFNRKPRKGDELQDFFEVFATMVEKLKDRQRKEVEQLEEAIEAVRASGASEEAVSKIMLVRDEMKKALDM